MRRWTFLIFMPCWWANASAQVDGVNVNAAIQVVFNRYITTGPTGATGSVERTYDASKWGWGIDFGIVGGQETYGGSYSYWQHGGWITHEYSYRTYMRMVNLDVRANYLLIPNKSFYSLTLGGGLGVGFVDFQYPRKVLLEGGIIQDIDQRRLRHFIPLIVTCIDNKFHLDDRLHLFVRFHFKWGIIKAPEILIESENITPGGYSRGRNEFDKKEKWHGFSFGGGLRF